MMKVNLAAQVLSSTMAVAINSLVTVGKENYGMSSNDTLAYQRFCYVVQAVHVHYFLLWNSQS